ncbi:hypothetical protein ACLB2K_049476 [Fragaria x ananassa]
MVLPLQHVTQSASTTDMSEVLASSHHEPSKLAVVPRIGTLNQNQQEIYEVSNRRFLGRKMVSKRLSTMVKAEVVYLNGGQSSGSATTDPSGYAPSVKNSFSSKAEPQRLRNISRRRRPHTHRRVVKVNLGVGDVIQAEAWGLLYGLKLALQLKIDRLEVETDSAVLVNLFHSSNLALHPLGSLIDGCRNLMAKLQMARICHIFRESNMLADALAKHSITHDLGMVRFEGPPAHVAQAFLDDLCSTARARRSACFDV